MSKLAEKLELDTSGAVEGSADIIKEYFICQEHGLLISTSYCDKLRARTKGHKIKADLAAIIRGIEERPSTHATSCKSCPSYLTGTACGDYTKQQVLDNEHQEEYLKFCETRCRKNVENLRLVTKRVGMAAVVSYDGIYNT